MADKQLRIRHLIAWISLAAGATLALVLTILYLWIGDTHWMSDAIVVYPPVMWSIPLALLLIPVLLGKSWRLIAAAAMLIFSFLLINEEWRSLLRPSMTPDTQRSDLRVITWNIYGLSDWTTVLNELQQWEPDIVVFAETPDGAASDAILEHLTGPWEGFQWYDQGDSALLCRWPTEVLDSRKVGPWDKPVLARITLPAEDNTSTRSLLLCGLRLLMPASASSPLNWFGGTAQWPAIHNQRVDQYRQVGELVQDNRLESEPAIIAGILMCVPEANL